jgi:hypothetical protein
MEKTGFGWTAESAPVRKQTAEVPWQLREVIESDASCLEPARDFSQPDPDPVAGIVKGEEVTLTKSAATVTEAYQKLAKLLFAPGDIRPSAAPLHKATSVGSLPDWSWDLPVGDTLEKRASTARERFEAAAQEFFGSAHQEELAEFRELANQVLADERMSILSQE